MKIIIQRVSSASVVVRGKSIAAIDNGLMALVGIKKADTKEAVEWLSEKMLGLRIFEDDDGKMNHSVTDVQGELLLVPNFTLYADATQGNRPGFSDAESPARARELYNYLIEHTKENTDLTVRTGEFGAHMHVNLINDGPVTIIFEK